MPVTAWIWIAIIIVAIAYELWTALDDWVDEDGHETWPLTWVYRRLMCNRFIRTLTMGFFSWMIWHWIIELFWWDGPGWVDLIFVAAGLLFGFFAKPRHCTEED